MRVAEDRDPHRGQATDPVRCHRIGHVEPGEEWAEAAFVASNHPGEAPTGPARANQLALAEQVTGPLRSLSVGDTVTAHGQMLACENIGWRRVDPQPGDTP